MHTYLMYSTSSSPPWTAQPRHHPAPSPLPVAATIPSSASDIEAHVKFREQGRGADAVEDAGYKYDRGRAGRRVRETYGGVGAKEDADAVPADGDWQVEGGYDEGCDTGGPGWNLGKQEVGS